MAKGLQSWSVKEAGAPITSAESKETSQQPKYDKWQRTEEAVTPSPKIAIRW